MRLVSDDLVADARLVATRAVTIAAPPNSVFPWLRQMGFGRGGWYSYDWIGNLGRHSACSILPEWQDVGTGDVIPGGGPVRFEVVVAEEPRPFVLALPRSSTRIGFTRFEGHVTPGCRVTPSEDSPGASFGGP